MNKSSQDSEDPPVRVVSFQHLVPGPLDATWLVRGKIKHHRAFKREVGESGIVIEDESGTGGVVTFKGGWSERASKFFSVRIGKRVEVEAKGGTVERVVGKGGEPVKDKKGFVKFGIAFETGVEGRVWLKGDHAKPSSFKFDQATHAPVDERPTPQHYTLDSHSTNAHVRLPPSTHSLSNKHDRRLSNLNRTEPRKSLDGKILEAQVPVLASEPARSRDASVGNDVVVQAAGSQPVVGSSIRDEEQQVRPQQKNGKERPPRTDGGPPTKRQRRTARTEWGLTGNKPASTYVALASTSEMGNGGGRNVIACAFVKKAIYKTKGPDWGCMLKLYDPTNVAAGIDVSYFAPKEEELPKPNPGDIIVMQDINWSKDHRWFVAYKNKGQFLVIPPDVASKYDGSVPVEAFVAELERCRNRCARVTSVELKYARDLADWSRKYDLVGNIGSSIAGPSTTTADVDQGMTVAERSAGLLKGPGSTRPMVLISQLQPGTFADTRGEIVKYYNPHQIGNRRTAIPDKDCAQLYITDYTLHDELVQYNDKTVVDVPGQYTLQISVYGPHNQPLLNHPESDLRGMLVKLTNVRPKINPHGLLEATMYTDFVMRERLNGKDMINIEIYKNNAPKEWKDALMLRRNLYWAASPDDQVHKKDLTVLKEPSTSTPASKPNDEAYVDPLKPMSDTTGLERQAMADALAANFEGTYLFRARVVDHKPDKLEDFVIGYCTTCRQPLPDGVEKCLDHHQGAFMWNFALVLEGEGEGEGAGSSRPRIVVEVNGRQTDALFPDLPPSSKLCGRSSDPIYIASLRRRLSPLLGRIDSSSSSSSNKVRRRSSLEPLAGWTDFVVVASKEDGEDSLKWRLDPERTTFRDSI
ncbi:hypothetical protein JCM10212_004517 [Sporobolomyces blumeae]